MRRRRRRRDRDQDGHLRRGSGPVCDPRSDDALRRRHRYPRELRQHALPAEVRGTRRSPLRRAQRRKRERDAHRLRGVRAVLAQLEKPTRRDHRAGASGGQRMARAARRVLGVEDRHGVRLAQTATRALLLRRRVQHALAPVRRRHRGDQLHRRQAARLHVPDARGCGGRGVPYRHRAFPAGPEPALRGPGRAERRGGGGLQAVQRRPRRRRARGRFLPLVL